MSDYVIRSQNLSKQYKIDRLQKKKGVMLRDVIEEKVADGIDFFDSAISRKRTPKEKTSTQVFWALRDVSFDIHAGESVGVIGSNGAGKSTLLKILTRITAPTSGRVHLLGRVGSLLEVGTGFHQDLTGRENVYLNGAILGMRRWEVDKKFDEIVAFSEVEEFLETPVKFYSSGMRMRLAFSVAAHLDPEILLIDEVLAVGDLAFQRKSLNKMGDVIGDGRTVLFVSHNMAAVRTLCQRAIYLDKGSIVSNGPVEEVIQMYLDASGENFEGMEIEKTGKTKYPRIISAMVLTNQNQPSTNLPYEKPFRIRFKLAIDYPISQIYLTIKLYNQDLETVLETHEFEQSEDCLQDRVIGQYDYEITIPANLLLPGKYFLGFQINQFKKRKNRNKLSILHEVNHVVPFSIFDGGSQLAKFGIVLKGHVHVPVNWQNAKFNMADNV